MKLLTFKVSVSIRLLNILVHSPLSLHNIIKTPENAMFPRVCVTNLFLFKTERITFDKAFNRITHCIHKVIEVINRSVQLLTCLCVCVPSIVAYFCNKVYTPWMHNNVVILNEGNTVVDTVLALPCFPSESACT